MPLLPGVKNFLAHVIVSVDEIENIMRSLDTHKAIGHDNNNNNNFYLSVSVFSTAVLIGDTVNEETNIVNEQKLVKNPNW